ncbi:VOC family protein [Nocardioides sp. LHG3406-4]|uniref:VOC family protein n=1 Tax=Nocardioides sp. LHG3406-4 TaxID=2804575 RepID=UPI003CFB942F
MVINRTTGSSSVVPELVYADVERAIEWLCATFGFIEIWRAGGHRARLPLGKGVVILADADPRYGRTAPPREGPHSHAVMVKVDDVDAHHERAQQHGAAILNPPTDYPYGERQYSVADFAGHRWTFTQAIADLAPEDWGGTSAASSTDGGGVGATTTTSP